MVTNKPISPFQMTRQEETASRTVITGTGTETIGAAAGIVLSILALVGILAPMFAAITLIVLGASVFLESAAVASNLRVIKRETTSDRPEEAGFVGGLSLTTIAAIGAVVLGILALLGILPGVLLAVGTIVVGACGVLASAEDRAVSHFPAAFTEPVDARGVELAGTRMSLNDAPAGLEVLGGVATIVLGILALCGINAAVMIYTGLLVMSSCLFLSSAAQTGRLAKFLAR